MMADDKPEHAMTTSEAGHMGGERVKKLIQEGKELEERKTESSQSREREEDEETL